MPAPMIEVQAVTKRFGRVQALAGVSLAAEAGRVLALLGPNGAGKTTLVRILATLLRPDGGRARVAGYDVVAGAGPLRSAIGLAGQYAAVDELLTGRENLELVGLLYHLSRREYKSRAAGALERFGLTDAGDRPVKTYSGGMRRRLDIAASLIGRPPVLFLDEPTTGLDPRTRNDLWQFIEDLAGGGTTVLLTTQVMEEAERLAHHIVVVDGGQVIAEGTTGELKDRLGGAVLEARVTRPADLGRAAAALAGLGHGPPHIDPDQQRVSIPASGGTRDLMAAGRRLEDDGIDLDDLGIRRPSLDDVFLSLTSGPQASPPRQPARPAAAPENP
jgi:ABC-2 type transport system ATP-binding protein